MRPLKLASMLGILALTIFAFAAANAFALPEILDHVPGTFTATGGAAELTDPKGPNIKCSSLSVTLANGKILNSKEVETTIDFEQCQIAGLAAISLGDKNDATGAKLGLILSTVKGELCYIGEAPNKEAGIFFKIPPLHIEAIALGELIEILTGSTVVALLTPNNTLKTGPFALTTKGVKQECDGKKAQILIELNHKTKLAAEEIASATITMDEDEELMVV